MPHDRHDFTRLLPDYYEFCNRVFWDATVAEAPYNSTGWSSINRKTMGNPEKTNVVIDLLRHIPCVDFPEKGMKYKSLILDETLMIDYRNEEIQRFIANGEIENQIEPDTEIDPILPPSCVVIAMPQDRYGYQMVLDTDDGYIHCGGAEGQHMSLNHD
ncbi:hypothetical protein ACHAQH_005663 [Verticillium albo-atrum]